MNGLRDLGDQLKEKLGEGVVVLASVKDGKVNLLAMATDAAQKEGAHAGNLIKAVAAIVGGGGGGRPNMAQAGGKNPEKAQAAMQKQQQRSILEKAAHKITKLCVIYRWQGKFFQKNRKRLLTKAFYAIIITVQKNTQTVVF